MRLPGLAVRSFVNVVGANVDENLGRFQIQQHSANVCQKIIRGGAADTAVIDGFGNAHAHGDFIHRELLHQGGARKENLPLLGNFVQIIIGTAQHILILYRLFFHSFGDFRGDFHCLSSL